MLMAGNNITCAADKLTKVTEEYLYHSLVHPLPAIESKIRQLRIIYSLDAKQYATQKRTLPYVVCGIFTPPHRNKENFAYIDRFILDLDHLCQKELKLEDVRAKIQADNRVLLGFASPSRDGLKLMFRLKERCYDAGLYTIFYRAFAKRFAMQYQLEQVIDNATCDVSRACFISSDSDAFYNQDAEPVNLKDYIDAENVTHMFDMIREQQKEEKLAISAPEQMPQNKDPEEEIMQEIRRRLNPNGIKAKQNKDIYVPEELNDIIDSLTDYINTNGMWVKEIISIQYGKKIRCQLGMKKSEVNLFYGKKGFSVVISPCNGTNAELNELTSAIIHAFLETNT